ncbi:unnamed protein product [Cutaneotrichosporon oleaginosum]
MCRLLRLFGWRKVSATEASAPNVDSLRISSVNNSEWRKIGAGPSLKPQLRPTHTPWEESGNAAVPEAPVATAGRRAPPSTESTSTRQSRRPTAGGGDVQHESVLHHEQISAASQVEGDAVAGGCKPRRGDDRITHAAERSQESTWPGHARSLA